MPNPPTFLDTEPVSRPASSRVFFYGWLVVAAGFATTATLGEAFYCFGVFFKPIQDEFGWSRSLVSSGYTACVIGYAISAAVTGRLADRYNPRLILLACASLVGLGFSLSSLINGIDQLRLFLFIAGLGAGAALSVPTSTVQRWFRGKHSSGTALAVVVSGIGVGQLIFPPLINEFILKYGWRDAYLFAGILFFTIILLSSLVMRRSPVVADPPDSETAGSINAGGWGTAKAMKTTAYAGIIFVACAGTIAFQTISVHLSPHATDLGMSPTAAALALSLLGGLTFPGRLTSGFISNRIGWQKALGWSLLVMSVSLLWLVFLNTTWMLYGSVILFGACWGVRSVAQLGILTEFYGLRSVGELIGITSGIGMIVGTGAPYVAGFIFDTTGSYVIAFAIMAILLLSGGIAAILLKKPPITPK